MRAFLVLVAFVIACRAPAAPKPIPVFIEDDYARALDEARRTHLPLFVDVWATWCTPCEQMKREVFTDLSLLPLRDHFVWLSIDTERPANLAFLARYPADALPMLWVIDAATDEVVLKRDKPASAASLRVLLATSTEIIASPDRSPRAIAARWAPALETAARAAVDADNRITFDGQRLDVYLALGEPERAIPMLEQSERDFPKWYEPPARLAVVYFALHRLDDARRASARALALVHGPRSIPVEAVAATIREASAAQRVAEPVAR